MTLDHPLALLTLLVIPLAILFYRRAERRRMRYAIQYPNLGVLRTVSRGRPWRRYVAPVLFLVAIASLCVGLARPHVTSVVVKDHATVILVIDTSRSMEARDVKPTRLGAAQAAMRIFLTHVPKRLQIALIAFATGPLTAAPPTTDHQLVRRSLDSIGKYSGFGGTAIGDALAAAVDLGEQAIGQGARPLAAATRSAAQPADVHGLVSILFLSDGKQTVGELDPLDGAARARSAGIPVFAISLGKPNATVPRGSAFGFGGSGGGGPKFRGRIPVPPDPSTLRAVAISTGGEFFDARSAEALQSAYARIGSRVGRLRGRDEVTFGFLAGAVGFLLAAGLFSARWSPRFP